MSAQCPPPPPPSFQPLTIILSCKEPVRPVQAVPARSTFCYVNTTRFVTRQDLIVNQNNWETFERVENVNSIVREKLAQSVPPTASAVSERVWYQFANDQERNAYKAGQTAHVAQYPDVSDFLVPYSNKPIPYTSSILSTIAGLPPESCVNCVCARPLLGKPITNDERLSNVNAQLVYIKASTQTALYPKSPYKFVSSDEYLLYKRYLVTNNIR